MKYNTTSGASPGGRSARSTGQLAARLDDVPDHGVG